MRDKQKEVDDHGGCHDSLGGIRVDPNGGRPCRTKRARASIIRLGLRRRAGRRNGNVVVDDMGQCQRGRNADDGSQSQHQPNHDTSEITGEDRVDHNKDMLVLQFAEAKVDTSREKPDQEVQVKEERGPSSRLVLGNGRNDGNMDLSVVGVPKGVEPAAPWRDDTRKRESNNTNKAKACNDDDHASEKLLELLGWDKASDEISKGHQLKQPEDTWSTY